MVIKKKATRSESVTTTEQIEFQDQIAAVIERGGKTSADTDAVQLPQEQFQEEEEFRFTLRGPKNLLKEIDKAKKNRIGNVSRNQWILEAIQARLSEDSLR